MTRKYQSPFLKQVIVRLDFSYPVTELSRKLPKQLKDQILPLFPISEPREFTGKELVITKDTTKEKTETGTNWLFHSLDRQKTLTIASSNINITYGNYESFELLKQDFLPIVETLLDIYSDIEGTRLGLRYINEISLQETDMFDWGNYLNNKLLDNLKFPEDPQVICRAFTNLELNFVDLILRFQFGMFNSDYPATIRKKSFILDYDAYHQGPQNLEDIKINLDRFHVEVQKVFEQSITDGLRKLMGVLNNGQQE